MSQPDPRGAVTPEHRSLSAHRHRSPGAALLAAVTVLIGAALAGCGGSDAGASAKELRATGLTLYLPELAGNLPVGVIDSPEPGVQEMGPTPEPLARGAHERARPTGVEIDADGVLVTYTRDGAPAYRLHQQRVPKGPLCQAVSQLAGSECKEAAGVMRSTMEEQATIAVVRGDTLLILEGLVTEAHPGLVVAAVAILHRAPVASPEQLAAMAD